MSSCYSAVVFEWQRALFEFSIRLPRPKHHVSRRLIV
ncbi:hypothetical protein L914_10839 [Phytophthora nicotianae]|uniref:Uncharacterized protein n=1 Tax=Phytophthora nicotianae TaxID=4792 RepID=W2N591_PHYNI|nr:hypothetical protein L914_10839 [Phytophthora nicotianae]